MNLFLFESLPLRTTRMLGDFAEDKPLPHRYGDLTAARFPLIRLSPTEFFAADHPMEVTRVFTDVEETQSWAQSLQSDLKGHTWTIVTLGAPAPATAIVSACGKGKRNPTTGALLENPAEILQDVYRLAGRSDDWGQLRAESAAAGLTIAGSISTAQPIGTQTDDVARSIGAIWTPGMARLYPTSAIAGPVINLEKTDAANLSVTASITDTADVLRLGYDVSDATGKAQHFIELSASPQRFGGVVREMTFDWLRTPANAEPVARRYLEFLAGERYAVQFSARRTDVRPGRWVRLVAHPEWPFSGSDPVMMVLGASISPDPDTVVARCVYLRSVPTISVSAHSVGLSDTTEGAAEVATRDGVTTITVTDRDGRPAAGARVSIDGAPAKTADQAGQVSFIVDPGTHTLDIELQGFTPIELQIITQ